MRIKSCNHAMLKCVDCGSEVISVERERRIKSQAMGTRNICAVIDYQPSCGH